MFFSNAVSLCLVYKKIRHLVSHTSHTRYQICIAAKDGDRSFRLFTVPELNKLNVLYAILAVLSALEQNNIDTIAVEECGICMDDLPNCVLPCGHQLCTRCEKLWVIDCRTFIPIGLLQGPHGAISIKAHFAYVTNSILFGTRFCIGICPKI